MRSGNKGLVAKNSAKTQNPFFSLSNLATLIDMLAERGISVNRSTIYRWFIEYSPKLRKKLRRNYQFLKRCLKHYPLDKPPKTLNTDKHSSYANAMARLMSGFVMMNVNPLCGKDPPSYIDYLKLRSFFNNNESIAELIYRLRLFATTPRATNISSWLGFSALRRLPHLILSRTYMCSTPSYDNSDKFKLMWGRKPL